MPEYQPRAINRPQNEMERGYLDTAEWTDQGGAIEPVDNPRWSEKALAEAAETCEDFRELCEQEGIPLDVWDPYTVGHDLWLTRNGHGAGFWDGDYGVHGNRLTKLCKPYGEAYVEFYNGEFDIS